MRGTTAVLAFALGACSQDGSGGGDPYAMRTYEFGPFDIAPGEEVTSQCVQISLGNTEEMFVNQVELTTGQGFHHSNWLWVPEHIFPGPDGTFTCDDRAFNQATAAIYGGVFFAQSTQSTHEIQQFPAGVAIKVPPKSKLVSQIHLLNPGDEPLALTPNMKVTPLAPETVTTQLAAVTFEYHTLGLPPHKLSRFSVECDLAPRHQELFGRAPDFNIYYALAHYHEWGTGLRLEALKPDGTAATIYSTQNKVGDALGGMLEPTFSMSGYTKFRLTCDYQNDGDKTIYYGNGEGEMCIVLGFSDSQFIWAGGALDTGDPGTPVDDGGVATFTRGCQVFATDATH